MKAARVTEFSHSKPHSFLMATSEIKFRRVLERKFQGKISVCVCEDHLRSVGESSLNTGSWTNLDFSKYLT